MELSNRSNPLHSQGSWPCRPTTYQPLSTGAKFANEEANGNSLLQSNGFDSEGRSPPLPLLRSARWWLPEILASLVSVGSFVAIVVVLRYCRGQGVQEVKLPLSLTFNGLIALLSTVNRDFFVRSSEGYMFPDPLLGKTNPEHFSPLSYYFAEGHCLRPCPDVLNAIGRC